MNKNLPPQKKFSFCLLLAVSFFLTSCAHFHATQLESFFDPENPDEPRVSTFAVTKNNMVIPEYVIDRKGNYPTSREEAWQRFNDRKEELEPLVTKKYKTENNFSYQLKRSLFGVGFIVVSPVAIPIIYLSEKWGKDKAGPQAEKRGVAARYFEDALNPPVPLKPILRNEMEIL